MSNPDLVPKKSKKKFYVGIMAVVLIVIIVGAAAFYLSSNGTSTPSSKMPTLKSMAGTYVGTDYSIILYENGTARFSTYSGTWHIFNATTIVGTYSIFNFPRDSYFTITNNGFTAVETGNKYIKK
jgi:TM2 domain-containing membrane protein YozV